MREKILNKESRKRKSPDNISKPPSASGQPKGPDIHLKKGRFNEAGSKEENEASPDTEEEKPSKPAHLTLEHWNNYNTAFQDKGVQAVAYNTLGEKFCTSSYSENHFSNYQFARHLNIPCKRILQFGSSVGRFLTPFVELGWKITAYDFSPQAQEALIQNGVNARLVNLNSRDKEGLTYSSTLKADVSEPVNILLIRILPYLEPEALNLLLLSLITEAAPGSTFFIADNPLPPYKAMHTASFFAQRSNFQTLYQGNECCDDLLVVRKI
ncbi:MULTISPECIES: hypothetical protein [Legionella]|uniref:hypothetical protein n=1 Tax=Legionella TaxID=445 RepID=UPI0007310208|nr:MULTISPECIES: hypothetical protein [Legionella]PJE13410.1 MAG: hypothetical protein CK430_06540 [Legionella sp.]